MARNTPDTESNQSVGDRLRLIRMAYGDLQHREKTISQAEFARMCNLTAPALNNAETGDNLIGLQAAKNVHRRTGATLDYIFFGNRNTMPHALMVAIEKREREITTSKRA